MTNRDNCDLHIPFKALRAESITDIAKLARDISEDMKTIERWAQYFRKNCAGGAVCEGAGSAQCSGQEFLNGSGYAVCTLIGTAIHECGVDVTTSNMVVALAGVYHITGHVRFSGFVGAPAATPLDPSGIYIATTPGNDSLVSEALGWPRNDGSGWIDGTLEVSADIYVPAGGTIVLLFSNKTGGTASIVVQLDAHLVHCDCEGVLIGGGCG